MVPKKNAGKMPAMQFYPGDWRKDPGVQALGYHDRGVWFEIICLMHESSERGVLLLNGHPMPAQALANILGLDIQILNQTLSNLTTYGVAKVRDSDGALYSKRMVADEKLCQIRREAGKKGGNPALLNQKPNQPDNQATNQTATPSSSSSTSFNSVTTVTGADAPPPAETTKEQIWRAGKSLLANAGMDKAQCGTFIGKLIRDYDEQTVLEAVQAGVSEQPADPKAYLKATCQRVAGERKPKGDGVPGWWKSDDLALKQANLVGVGPARSSESRDSWHGRIRAAIDNGGKPPERESVAPAPTAAAQPEAVRSEMTPEQQAENRAALKAALKGTATIVQSA